MKKITIKNHSKGNVLLRAITSAVQDCGAHLDSRKFIINMSLKKF